MIELAKKVLRVLIKKKLSISMAESCTGGLLSSLLTYHSGASKVVKLGLVTYSNESKIRLLKVPKKILKKHGAVSSETCQYMLKGLNKLYATSLGVSITGIAGPHGGTKLKPVGLVYIGIRKKKKILIKKFIFENKKRKQIQNLTVNEVFKLILLLCK